MEAVCRAGPRVNLDEKEACQAFLTSRILGSNSLRMRICEFVLTKKQLCKKYLSDRTRQRCENIAARLVGKTIIHASLTFARDLEGVELILQGGDRIVLSGRDCGAREGLRTVMWVRPSFDTLTRFQVDSVSGLVMTNPFVTDRYAKENKFGMPYDPQQMEVILLRSDGRQVLIGGHAGCTGCMEGCGVHGVAIQLYDKSSVLKFDNLPHLSFGHVRLLDRRVCRLVDEFGSRIDWINEVELSNMFCRYPLSASCAEELHEYLQFISPAWPCKPGPAREPFCIYVGDAVREPIGTNCLSEELSERFKKCRDARTGNTCPSSWAHREWGLPRPGTHGEHVCCWIFIKNPSCSDIEAVLKFASACTLLIGSRCIATCLSDVEFEYHGVFLQALEGALTGTHLLFEYDLSACIGRQSCVVGAGWDHLLAPPNALVSGAESDDNDHYLLDDVIQEIPLCEDDQPASIPSAESERVADELWASGVERLLHHPYHGAQCEQAPTKTQALRLLTFSRHPEQLDLLLLQAPFVKLLIQQGVDVQPKWANGAKILAENVQPEQFDIELCPRHVIVAVEDEETVMDLLQQLPYGKRPRLKPGVGRFDIPCDTSLLQDASEDGHEELTESLHSASSRRLNGGNREDPCFFDVEDLLVKNTFIHFSQAPTTSPRTAKTV